MKVRFYSLSKRRNSTKVPANTDTYTEKDCTFKEPTSIKNPILLLSGNIFSYTANYAYIMSLNKYYFVKDMRMVTYDTFEIELEEDSLASNKGAVGATVAQIAYSSTSYDIWKIDSRIPAKVTKTITKASGTPGAFDATGCYVVSVVNVNSASSAVCYYALDQGNLRQLVSKIATDQTMQTAIKDYCAAAWDAIIGCIWLPVSISEIPGTASSTVYVGNLDSGATGKLISNPPVRATSATVNIPWTYNDFRRNAPYTSLSAWIPGFGYVDLNANDLVSDTSLKFEFKIDCMTGDCCCNIIDAVTSYIYQSISYNLGVTVPLAHYTMDVGGFVNGVTSVLGNATDAVIAGGLLNPAGVVSGAVSTIGAGVGLAIAANKREISVKGGTGGRAIISEGIDVELYAFSVDTEDPDDASYIATWGRPVGVTHAISNHSGYVQCDGASVTMAGEQFERDEINSFLNGGFYYE